MSGAARTIGGRRPGWPSREAVAAATLAIGTAIGGGASLNARPPLLVVELISLPVAAIALRRLISTGLWRRAVWPLALIAGLFTIPLLQSIPLPAALWLTAPGQEARFTTLVLSGADLGWAPISLNPAATIAAIPALFPPTAMFLITLCLDRGERRAMAAAWIGVAPAGVLLGLVQISLPDGGWPYLYGETSLGSLVGWFANRNHEAAMLLALTPRLRSSPRGAARADGSAAPSS